MIKLLQFLGLIVKVPMKVRVLHLDEIARVLGVKVHLMTRTSTEKVKYHLILHFVLIFKVRLDLKMKCLRNAIDQNHQALIPNLTEGIAKMLLKRHFVVTVSLILYLRSIFDQILFLVLFMIAKLTDLNPMKLLINTIPAVAVWDIQTTKDMINATDQKAQSPMGRVFGMMVLIHHHIARAIGMKVLILFHMVRTIVQKAQILYHMERVTDQTVQIQCHHMVRDTGQICQICHKTCHHMAAETAKQPSTVSPFVTNLCPMIAVGHMVTLTLVTLILWDMTPIGARPTAV